MYEGDSIWSNKGATLSDKSARQEFGLTQQEIVSAIHAGKLQFREGNMHGNPWFRLLRHEVEALVSEQSGPDQLHKKKLQKELADNGTIWEGIVVSNDGRLPSERMFEEPATVNDMAQLLADAMRRPLDGRCDVGVGRRS